MVEWQHHNQRKHYGILRAKDSLEVPDKKINFFKVFNHDNVWKVRIESSTYQTLAGLGPKEWAVGRLN